MDNLVTDIELKFAGDGAQGEFDGYASVFGHRDLHDDMVAPGAFAVSLAGLKAAGRGVPMHLNHGLPSLGGERGVGVFPDIAEDGKGLRVKGRISGMNTDKGRNLYERVKDGAFPGLSIGYSVPTGGAVRGTKAGEPKRLLKTLNLHEVSLVDTPSNGAALIEGVKSLGGGDAASRSVDAGKVLASVAAAMRLHDKAMAGESYSYGSASQKERAQLMNHLRDAHEELSGDRAPDGLDGWKAAETMAALERMLREDLNLPDEQARALIERRFKAAPPSGPTLSVAALRSVLDGFTLPTF